MANRRGGSTIILRGKSANAFINSLIHPPAPPLDLDVSASLKLTLCINQSGAWRKSMMFDASQFDAVKAAALPLAKILASDTAWRIDDADGKQLWHFDERPRGRQA